MVKHFNGARNFSFKEKLINVLLDIGSDEYFINKRWTSHGKQTKTVKPTTLVTGTSTIKNKRNVNMKLKLDECSQSKEVDWSFHVDENDVSKRSLGYAVSIGLELMCELGIIINCKLK